jgi:outer membrane protein OmpA-like peptidoglycan-associated protein
MRSFILFFVIVFFTLRLPAQTADELDVILATPAVDFTQASRFVLVIAEVVDEKTEPAAAYSLARERGWLSGDTSATGFSGKPIKQGELCFLIMQAFNMPGSFLYTLFPGPRYAFRELDYLKLIPGRRDPSLKVSGEELLRILGRVNAYVKEKDRPVESPVSEPPASTAGVEPPAPKPLPPVAESSVSRPPVPAAAESPASKPSPPASVAEPPAPKPLPPVAESPVSRPPASPAPKPVPVAAAKERGPVLAGRIQFEPNMSALPETETEKAKLQEIARILAQYPGRKVLVEGYTALAGDLEGRKSISMERAQSVADYLASLKLRRREEIVVRAYGAARPLGDNNSAAGKAMNRRVEIFMLDEEQL